MKFAIQLMVAFYMVLALVLFMGVASKDACPYTSDANCIAYNLGVVTSAFEHGKYDYEKFQKTETEEER